MADTIPGPDATLATPALEPITSATDLTTNVQQRYAEEREKRLRPEGLSQFVDLSQDDPWVDHQTLNSQTPPFEDGQRIKFLIIGAGFGGLLFAVRLIQAGIDADDIRIVDSAGGFGGTWWWNRYPGVMCDVESYIYLPLLEETGYMPKHKYSYGPEILEHARRIAEKYELTDKTMFRTVVDSLVWDESRDEWCVKMKQDRGGIEKRALAVQAECIMLASGPLNNPHVPNTPGLDKFEGQSFHTSRWNYEHTGGSPTDPTLDKLKGKKVGIIGTGATAIQAIPHLANYADHLYVFQRTPSSIDTRGQQPTDPELWKTQIANKPSWQKARNANFMAFTSNTLPLPTENLVDDAWTRMPSISALVGSPSQGIITEATIPSYLTNLHTMDLARSERVRSRVDELVDAEATAAGLKAWYPTWCKRPCFSDDYLPVFNRPNVSLIDTNGTGIDGLSAHGVVANETEHPLDVLVLATGFRSPVSGGPAASANMQILGRESRALEDVWAQQGVGTLHGVVARGFPNLFLIQIAQAGFTGNFSKVADTMAGHVAYIVSRARDRCVVAEKAGEGRFVVEPTLQAQQDWAERILMRAAAFVGMRGCTAGYFNKEGEADLVTSPEELMKAMKAVPWGEGMAGYIEVIEAWRAEGGMRGLSVTAPAVAVA